VLLIYCTFKFHMSSLHCICLQTRDNISKIRLHNSECYESYRSIVFSPKLMYNLATLFRAICDPTCLFYIIIKSNISRFFIQRLDKRKPKKRVLLQHFVFLLKIKISGFLWRFITAKVL